MIELPMIFGKGAVIQQGLPVPVWGKAISLERVEVHFRDQEKITTADEHGNWRITFDPLAPSDDPDILTIYTQDETVNVDQIYIGEVWVCAGQSNMAFNLNRCEDGRLMVKSATYPRLHFLKLPTVASKTVQVEVDTTWRQCSPMAARTMSAVSFFFGCQLAPYVKGHIGLIRATVAATPIEAWMSSCPQARAPLPTPDIISRAEGYNGFVLEPGDLYRGMVAPVQPYAVRGVLWYQGEANTANAHDYQQLLTTMIAQWRDGWEQPSKLPFLLAQIAPYGKARVGRRAFVRDAQSRTVATVANTALITTMDVGEADERHPPNKYPVGQRFALAARALAYGEDVEYSGPVYDQVTWEDNEAIISFTHVAEGLETFDGKALRDFWICGANRRFFRTEPPIIRGGTVVVSHPDVSAPEAVRYAFSNCPTGNLCNTFGLPASPFRTDDYPLPVR